MPLYKSVPAAKTTGHEIPNGYSIDTIYGAGMTQRFSEFEKSIDNLMFFDDNTHNEKVYRYSGFTGYRYW
jgi:hypothetical protein